MGGGASGPGGMPTHLEIGKFAIHMQKGGEDAEEEGKTALVATKTEEKGRLIMDSMVESSWRPKE